MRVTIIGANGSTGTEVVRACHDRGHEVVAAVRRPETVASLAEGLDRVSVAKIDLNAPESLVAAIDGSDAVVSCLGHGGLKAAAKPTTLYSDSARALRAAMQETDCRRLLMISSGGVEFDAAAPWFYTALLRKHLINTYLDMARMETVLEESDDLEWTCVRLTYLLDGPSRDYLVRDRVIGEGNFKIHFVDAARFIADELTDREWIGRHPVLGYP